MLIFLYTKTEKKHTHTNESITYETTYMGIGHDYGSKNYLSMTDDMMTITVK